MRNGQSADPSNPKAIVAQLTRLITGRRCNRRGCPHLGAPVFLRNGLASLVLQPRAT